MDERNSTHSSSPDALLVTACLSGRGQLHSGHQRAFVMIRKPDRRRVEKLLCVNTSLALWPQVDQAPSRPQRPWDSCWRRASPSLAPGLEARKQLKCQAAVQSYQKKSSSLSPLPSLLSPLEKPPKEKHLDGGGEPAAALSVARPWKQVPAGHQLAPPPPTPRGVSTKNDGHVMDSSVTCLFAL